jgi:hypothetical protein
LNFDRWFEKGTVNPAGMSEMNTMNLHPEWGCLAPAPSFLRIVRTALAVTAVGATAGGGVVLSLADHSAGQTSVAERTLVRPMSGASTPLSAPQTAQLNAQTINQQESAESSPADDGVEESATNELNPSSPVRQAVVAADTRAATDNTYVKTTVAMSPTVRIRPKRIAERARRSKVSASRQRQQSLVPQSTPNVIQRFLTGLTAAIEHGFPSPRLPASRTSRAHGNNPSAAAS